VRKRLCSKRFLGSPVTANKPLKGVMLNSRKLLQGKGWVARFVRTFPAQAECSEALAKEHGEASEGQPRFTQRSTGVVGPSASALSTNSGLRRTSRPRPRRPAGIRAAWLLRCACLPVGRPGKLRKPSHPPALSARMPSTHCSTEDVPGARSSPPG